MPIDRDATLKIADDFLRDGRVDDAAACVELAVDEYVIAGRFTDAATLLQDFLVRVPGRMPTLLRLVEVCRDGGLEGAMYDAQALLADAYLAAGQAAEALVIAEDLIAREPDREDHRVRLARAKEAMERAAKPAAPTKPRQPVEIDLDAALKEVEAQMAAVAERPRDLEEVFSTLRTGLAGDDDTSGDHLALGRTFMEMGMMRDAVESLEIAAKSPRHRFAAAWMLGGIHRQQGNLSDAIEWLERAAQAPPTSPEDGRGLLYDLGDVLEAAGEKARALAVFLELRADAPDYRDVAGRVSRLSGAETEG